MKDKSEINPNLRPMFYSEEITNYEVRFNTHYHFSIPIYKDWYIDLCVII